MADSEYESDASSDWGQEHCRLCSQHLWGSNTQEVCGTCVSNAEVMEDILTTITRLDEQKMKEMLSDVKFTLEIEKLNGNRQELATSLREVNDKYYKFVNYLR